MQRTTESDRTLRGHRRAARANLVYVNDFDAGYTRRRRGRGFSYHNSRGRTITSARTRKRIEALAIPPAWEEVWVCPKTNGHIQARGRDEAGRWQYIYHARWQAVSAAAKYDRLQLMARVLPRVRRRVRKDLGGKQLTRRRVVAAAVRLIDKAAIRVGNAVYTESHGTRGVTTLGPEHVDVDDLRISLDFPGKSGRRRVVDLRDRKLARVIDHCEEIDGQFLFCYRDADGEYRPIDSADVNQYLEEIARDPVTAKDFRTWAGSVTALTFLADTPSPATVTARRRRVARAVDVTAEVLGNTRAVCRNSYIHPALLAAAETGELDQMLAATRELTPEQRIAELTVDECRFAALLPRLTA